MSEPILHFTEKAVEHIKKSLVRYPNGGFRLMTKKAGCTGNKYIPEIVRERKPGDVAWTTEQGLHVFVDAACVDAIRGTRVDLVSKSLGQKQLVFTNPNAAGECGCGESFYLEGETHGE